MRFYTGHSNEIPAVCISKDGTKLYTASIGEIFEWDTYSGHKRPFGGDESKVPNKEVKISAIIISNDGKFLYSGDMNGKILKWKLQDLQLSSEICPGDDPDSFDPSDSGINTLCSTNEHTLFSAGASMTIDQWDMADQNLAHLERFEKKHTSAIQCIRSTKDGKHIISASDLTPVNQKVMTIVMWSVRDRKFVRTFEGHSGPATVREVCILNDELYGCSEVGDISVWNINTGEQLKFLQAVKYDLPADLTEPVSEEVKALVNTSAKEANAMCLVQEGKYLLCGRRDGTIDLWDMAANSIIYTYTGHTDAILDMCVAHNGQKFFSVSNDASMIQWDLITDSKPLECKNPANIQCMSLSSDSMYLYCDCNGEIVAWDLQKVDALLHTFNGSSDTKHKNIPSKKSEQPCPDAFCSSDKFLFRAVEDTIYRWSLPNPSNPTSFKALDSDVKSLCISRKGDFLYSAGCAPDEYGKPIIKWDTKDNSVVLKFESERAGNEGEVSRIQAMSLLEQRVSNELVTVLFSASEKIGVYDVNTGAALHLEGNGHPFHSICSWAGLVGNKIKIHVFAGNEKREIWHWTHECESFADTELSFQEWCKDEVFVDTTSVRTGGYVTTMCVSPDGKHLFSTCKDMQASESHFIYVWDIDERRMIIKLPFKDDITSLRFDEMNDCLVVSVGTVAYIVPYISQIRTQNGTPTWLLNAYLDLDIDDFDPDRQCNSVSHLITTPKACTIGNDSFFLGLLQEGRLNAVKKCFINVPSKFKTSTIPFDEMLKTMLMSERDTLECQRLILEQVGLSVQNYNGVKSLTETPQLMFNTFDAMVDKGSFVKTICDPRISDELLLSTLQKLPLLHLEQKFLPVESGIKTFCSASMMQALPASRRKGFWFSIFSNSSVNPEDYKNTKNSNVDSSSFEHCVTPFEGFIDVGKDSFLQRILACKGDARSQVFGTIIAASVVHYKWETVAKRQHYLECLFYTAVLSVAVAATFVKETEILDILYVILLASASMEMLDHICLNLDSLLTYIRLTTTTLTLATSICYFATDDLSLVDNFKSLMVYLRWIGLCYYVQPFPKLGPVVQMIIVILYEILDILLVAVILILGLSNGILVLLHSESNSEGFSDPLEAIYTTYKMILLGDFDDSAFAVGRFSTTISVIFVVSSLLGIIVILNLIIARMSDAYERIQEEAEMEHRRLQAQIIAKHEFFSGLIFRKQHNKTKRWLHVVQPAGLNNPIVEQSWSGVFHSIKKNLSAVESNVKNELETSNLMLEDRIVKKLIESNKNMMKELIRNDKSLSNTLEDPHFLDKLDKFLDQ